MGFINQIIIYSNTAHQTRNHLFISHNHLKKKSESHGDGYCIKNSGWIIQDLTASIKIINNNLRRIHIK